MTISTDWAISKALSLNIGWTGKSWWLFVMNFVDKYGITKCIYLLFYMPVPPPLCFLFSQRDHNENKVYFWPVLCYPCHSILIVKLLDTYFVFCKVVFCTHLLYLFGVANKYLLTYFHPWFPEFTSNLLLIARPHFHTLRTSQFYH